MKNLLTILLCLFLLSACGSYAQAQGEADNRLPIIEREQIRRVPFPQGYVIVYEAVFSRDKSYSQERQKAIHAWLVLHDQKQCFVSNQ